MTKLGASSRDAGRTLAPSLTFSMVASSDTSYTTHTTLACGGGHVAQHYQRLPVHATPALRQDTAWLRDPGSHSSLALLSQCPLVVSETQPPQKFGTQIWPRSVTPCHFGQKRCREQHP